MSVTPNDRGAGATHGRYEVSPRRKKGAALGALGQPYVWLAGGMLALCVAMIVGLVLFILIRGMATFWPGPVVAYETHDGTVHLGEVTRTSHYQPRPELLDALPEQVRGDARRILEEQGGSARRYLVRTGNFEMTNEHFNWVSDFLIHNEEYPEWVLLFERLTWGRFYGMPQAFFVDDRQIADQPAAIWSEFRRYHDEVRQRWHERRDLEIDAIGAVNHYLEKARLDLREHELAQRTAVKKSGADSDQARRATAELEAARQDYAAVEQRGQREYAEIRGRIDQIDAENDRFRIVVGTADGREKSLQLAEIVRAYTPNQLDLFDRLGIYASRWLEFLVDDPREANSEGGVFPAIFGTVVMTLIMVICVVPFGVLSALYLREYAKAGPLVSVIRIAINNLAGVPSIVYGVFGLGFFCYLVGGSIDQLFYSAKLPSPTFGTGGIFWASLTLALLTLPVVIVATEEALAAVPGSMREGSYACGASKWQTIRRIVLPRAMPGILTGAILAMARGAGEVAPLMLVGAVKLAPELPIDGFAPFVHLERSFMHLGFHIYDLGFQSQNSEAAVPMVFTTTLLLILIIFLLNIGAIQLRTRLKKRFIVSAV